MAYILENGKISFVQAGTATNVLSIQFQYYNVSLVLKMNLKEYYIVMFYKLYFINCLYVLCYMFYKLNIAYKVNKSKFATILYEV